MKRMEVVVAEAHVELLARGRAPFSYRARVASRLWKLYVIMEGRKVNG